MILYPYLVTACLGTIPQTSSHSQYEFFCLNQYFLNIAMTF